MSATNYFRQLNHSVSRELVKYLVSFLIVGSGVVAFVVLKSLAKPPATQASNALVQQVNIVEAKPYSGVLDRVVSGTVVPHREIRIATEVAGGVIKKYAACEAGNFVSRGEKLIEIDSEEYELDIKTLEAEVVQSEKRIEENRQQILGERSNIELARKDLALNQREFERNRRLAGVISQSELDQSRRTLNSSQSQLTNRESNLSTMNAATARLEAALELSNRQLEKAKLNLRRTTIVAPQDGVIVQEMVQEGDYVPKGTQIVVFEDTEQVEVLCNLTPKDLKWVRDHAPAGSGEVSFDSRAAYRLPKTEVTIVDPANRSVVWRGTLERFDGIGRDEVTKTIPCRIVVDTPVVQTKSGAHALVRGMFVKCRIEVSASNVSDDLVLFPAMALQPDNCVWTVENKTLHHVAVIVADRIERDVAGKKEQFVVVHAGEKTIRSGDSIIVSPLSQPTEGAPVLLKDSQPPGD